ncbi:hypothetical protein B0H16DRAFT_1842255 [Mycena metata]|uniref:Uncharacterized protein n=1 Tax=Mycena metata TaxID=1033252 RepID=A0AAD7N943_9AGAR|nr:hypothetical protein B0H16DRAFT_1842255 [Mycena metata]
MVGSRTLPLALGREDNSYELVPADPDHDPLLSSTENISPRRPKNKFIRKLVLTGIWATLALLPSGLPVKCNIYPGPLPSGQTNILRAVTDSRSFNLRHTAVGHCAGRNRLHVPPLQPTTPLESPEPPSTVEPPPVTGKLIPNDPVDAVRLHVDALFARQSATYARAAARYSLKTGRAPPRATTSGSPLRRSTRASSTSTTRYSGTLRRSMTSQRTIRFFQSRVDIAADVSLGDDEKLLIGAFQVKHPISEAGGLVVKDGRVHMPQGVDLRYSILGRRAYDIQQNMTFIVNGKDQPRVVFDYREPGNETRDRALSLTENGHPFELVPHPTTAQFFRKRPGCEVLRGADGFADVANDDSGFFLSSSLAYFTLDLYPVLSVTKVSPCFADIVFPSEYYYQRSSTAPKFAYLDNIPWKDKRSQAYWHGTATGGQIVGANYHNFTRFKLVDLSTAHPDLVDAKIMRFADLLCLAEDGCDRVKIVQAYGIDGAGAPQ